MSLLQFRPETAASVLPLRIVRVASVCNNCGTLAVVPGHEWRVGRLTA